MIRKLSGAMLCVAGVSGASWAQAGEAGPVRYGICPGNVARAVVEEHLDGNGFMVVVSLRPDAAAQFRALIEEHWQEPVDVVYDGMVLERARGLTPNAQGPMLLGRWTKRAAAEEIRDELLDPKREASCGLIR